MDLVIFKYNVLSMSIEYFAGMVDTIFADVAQPDQARIVAINAHMYLKNEGHVVISIKVSFSSAVLSPEITFPAKLSDEILLFCLADMHN